VLYSCSQLHKNKIHASQHPDALPTIVIGGGIGGLTAAIYLAQSNISPIIIQGPKAGGALVQSHSVRNWPGITDAPGQTILDAIYQQAEENHVIIKQEQVVSVNFKTYPFIITTRSLQNPAETKQYKTLSCIIATGAEPNYLHVPGETGNEGYLGKGVSTCAVCDGALYRNKNIFVIGGGDTALTEAEYLSSLVQKVTILVRKDYLRARDVSKRERVLGKPNVSVLFNTEVLEIMGDTQHVTQVLVKNNKTQAQTTLQIDGIFLAIGTHPNTEYFKNQLELDENNFIVRKKYQETSVPGIFAVGDVTDPEFKQAITAAGDGCKAALQVKNFLDNSGYTNPIQQTLNTHLKHTPEERTSVSQELLLDTSPNTKHNQQTTSNQKIAPIQEITTEQEFNKNILQSKLPVILDLFTPMCFACKQIAPLLEKYAQQYSKKVKFLKIDMSNKKLNAQKLIGTLSSTPIDSVPTILLIIHGKEVARLTDDINELTIKKFLALTIHS
jgi:thioredoxin reductase (NADPH)